MADWGNAAKGAAGGAAAGAALGLPGAAAGGLIGGVLGMFGGGGGRSDEDQKRLQHFMNREAYQSSKTRIGQMAQADGGQQFRAGQSQLISQLQNQAAGRGPSLAGMQAKQVANQSLAQQQALAASAGPGNEAMAARSAAMNAGNTMSGLAGTAAMARAQEQMNAQGMLGSALQGARGQDMNNEQFNAGSLNNRTMQQATMNQQNKQFNVGAEYQNRTGNDAAEMGIRGKAPAPSMGDQLMSGGAQTLAFTSSNKMGGFGNQENGGWSKYRPW